ncbi:hypothetical protein BGZ47_007037 [Haplosporangium gracile]|nr:hypothetical protein BGZ47_007037 [Haplosporangium gracile]
MDHLEAAALAAAPSTIASIANPDIKINSLDSSQISGSFHDEASLKESLARSQSDTLNSLKISIDLQSGCVQRAVDR